MRGLTFVNLVVIALVANVLSAADVYKVSSVDGLETELAALAALREQQDMAEAIIELSDGSYELDEAIRLTPDLVGRGAARIVGFAHDVLHPEHGEKIGLRTGRKMHIAAFQLRQKERSIHQPRCQRA